MPDREDGRAVLPGLVLSLYSAAFRPEKDEDPRMTSATLDVVGIGNAIVDVIAHADERFLADESLAKGAMTLIDAARAEALYAKMGPAIESSGGSAGNTMAGHRLARRRPGALYRQGARRHAGRRCSATTSPRSASGSTRRPPPPGRAPRAA